MGNIIQSTVIGALFAAFIIGVFLIPIREANVSYGAGIDTTNLTSLDRLDDLLGESESIRSQTTEETSVDTQASEASFFTNAYTVGKFIITGGPFNIIISMLNDASNALPIPSLVFKLLYSILLVALSFALIKSITGR
jgi:hypothetical protein